MYWLKYSLLATTICALYCQDSAAQTESTSKFEEAMVYPKVTPEPSLTDVSPGFIEEAKNGTNSGNVTNEVQVSLKSGPKREVENVTFNDIKPFLLFPILPFLFPPREEESLNSGKDEFSVPKNNTLKVEGNLPEGKPFIFFDFAFNIRRIPIKNATDNLNDSKIINVKKLSTDSEESKAKDRRRRNTKVETPGFFDDAPFFPDSELDEFLPKPDLFFPDLPFHHKPSKKVSRRKRDQKKTELKNDLKSFFDAFDETFMRAKRELEWTDPILNLLRGGGEQSFEEKKDSDDLFGQLTDIREKPSVKWRIQRNIKRLNNDHKDGLVKSQDSPTIIVDKVVKIGEFHVHDDGHDKTKSKKKRGLIDSKRKFVGHDNHDEIISDLNDDSIPKSIFEMIKQEGSKRKKRNHVKNLSFDEDKRTESKEIENSTEMNASFGSKESNKKEKGDSDQINNGTEKLLDFKRLFSSLKSKMDQENAIPGSSEKDSNQREGVEYGRTLKEELNKNLTQLLKQFLALNKRLDNAKLMEKLEVSDQDDARTFDWTEKETLQNSNVPGKGTRGKRQKKDAYFQDENNNSGNKELQIADLNFLFLNVTLPTVCVLVVMLLVCFFALQVKARLCTTLFRSRRVLVVNDEATAQLKNPGTKKAQAI